MLKTMTAAGALATLLLLEPTGAATAQNTVTSNSSSSEKHRPNQEKTFYSEEVLNKSIAEISEMPEAELRSLAHYFAECDDTTAQGTHACSAARAAYLMEFGAKRPIDDWIGARSGLEQTE